VKAAVSAAATGIVRLAALDPELFVAVRVTVFVPTVV
jgi:hypothetical protein